MLNKKEFKLINTMIETNRLLSEKALALEIRVFSVEVAILKIKKGGEVKCNKQ